MPWEDIAESLRQELAGYGGLLHLFENQQPALSDRDLDRVLARCPAIEARALTLAGCRKDREGRVAAFALEHGRASDSPIRSLLDLIDADARPLLEALIDEVNHLLQRVRVASGQNHAQLSRALELHQQLLRGQDAVAPAATPTLDHLLAETNSPRAMRAAG
jgi:FlgN protein